MAGDRAPSVIFLDEIDAIGAKRQDGSTSGDREVQRTLMQLLAELDGFDSLEGVSIIAATNRPDILDGALLRPGRFDRMIEIPIPDPDGRRADSRSPSQSGSTPWVSSNQHMGSAVLNSKR